MRGTSGSAWPNGTSQCLDSARGSLRSLCLNTAANPVAPGDTRSASAASWTVYRDVQHQRAAQRVYVTGPPPHTLASSRAERSKSLEFSRD